MSWKHRLQADPTGWLLQAEHPAVRYGTLVDLLERPPDDPEVRAARAEIASFPPVAELLAAQGPDGDWGRGDFYLPRAGRGTFWVLSVLGDLGLTAEQEPIRRGCDFIFSHQRPDGSLCRRSFYGRQRLSGRGEVWHDHTEPCTQARIVRFLLQFGYASDPRLRRAIDWLLSVQRQDGMGSCRGEQGRGCLRATLDLLHVAALDPQTAAQPGIPLAVDAVTHLLMEPRMSRYHVGEAWGTWTCLKYPYFGFSLISALQALARLGVTPAEPRVAAALDYLLSRQLPAGPWPLDEGWPTAPLDFGAPGQPNPWVTLDALRVIKRLSL